MKPVETILNNIAELFKVKSIVTLCLTFGMLLLLSGKWQPSQEIVAIYSSAWASVITYFFTKKEEKVETNEVEQDILD